MNVQGEQSNEKAKRRKDSVQFRCNTVHPDKA